MQKKASKIFVARKFLVVLSFLVAGCVGSAVAPVSNAQAAPTAIALAKDYSKAEEHAALWQRNCWVEEFLGWLSLWPWMDVSCIQRDSALRIWRSEFLFGRRRNSGLEACQSRSLRSRWYSL